MLLPREVDIAAVGREAPLPVPRPKIAGAEVQKEDGQARTGLDGAIAHDWQQDAIASASGAEPPASRLKASPDLRS